MQQRETDGAWLSCEVCSCWKYPWKYDWKYPWKYPWTYPWKSHWKYQFQKVAISIYCTDTAVVESQTTVADKDQIHIIMRHFKYGPLKKGPGKKANIDEQSTKETPNTDAEEAENHGWTDTGANDDFGQLLDIPVNVGNVSNSPNNETLSSARGTSRSPSAGGYINYASNDGRETSGRRPGFSNVARQPKLNTNASPQSRGGAEQGFGEFSISKSPNLSHREVFLPILLVPLLVLQISVSSAIRRKLLRNMGDL